MIKIFRKIRQQLLTENKFSKYLIYAIGEIILVVIGILIALSIKNWNEGRKKKETLNNIYTIIKQDLETDLLNIDKIFTSMNPNEKMLMKVINQTMTFEDYKSCEPCQRVLHGFPDYTFQERGIKLLENQSQSTNNDLKATITDFYSELNTEIDVDIEAISIGFLNNQYYWKNNKSWFTDFIRGISNDEFIEYALNSWDYRNRASEFHVLYYELYFGHLKEYKQRAKKIIEKINKTIN